MKKKMLQSMRISQKKSTRNLSRLWRKKNSRMRKTKFKEEKTSTTLCPSKGRNRRTTKKNLQKNSPSKTMKNMDMKLNPKFLTG